MKIFKARILKRGPGESRQIAVTFDDGPHHTNTRTLLRVLEGKRAEATFFSTGSNLSRNRSLAEEIVAAGHLLGNHFFNHTSAFFTGRRALWDEIVRTRELIEDISGEPNWYLRPPYGHISPALLSVCGQLDLSIVLWSFSSRDHKGKSAAAISRRAKRKLSGGSILLFHECHFSDDTLDYSSTAASLGTILDDAALRGFKAVTIADMFDEY